MRSRMVRGRSYPRRSARSTSRISASALPVMRPRLQPSTLKVTISVLGVSTLGLGASRVAPRVRVGAGCQARGSRVRLDGAQDESALAALALRDDVTGRDKSREGVLALVLAPRHEPDDLLL
jgi:hypothetical protein